MKIWTKCSEVLYALLNANCIRNELQNSSYQIPWQPKTEDLDVQTFTEFPLLQEFLVRLIYNEPSPKSERVKQHEISYTKLSEITTKVAYSIINKCLSGMVFLPEQFQKHQFTMIVEDNIDRNE